jgi:formate dehydrogenase major subunit
MMTGNIGRAGVGMNPLRGQNNVQGCADMGTQPHQGAGYLDVEDADARDHYEAIDGVALPKHAGLKIPKMYDAALAGSLKALWLMGEDLAQTDPNTGHVVAALKSLDFLVVQEIFMTETARLAHVILPATTFLEKSGTFTNGERRIQRVQQVIPPLEGTRTDGQIMVDIMNRMGYPQESADPAVLLREISRTVSFFEGVRWEELGDNGKQWPVYPDGTDSRLLHVHGFKRGRGKFHFFDWEESSELVDNAAQFPFILTTGRKLEHYNCGAMTRRTANADIVGQDVLLIHPDDAARKRIEDGDLVELASARGQTRLHAAVSTEVNPGVLYTTFHFPELKINTLTSSVADKEAMCPEYKVVAVDVHRVAPAPAPAAT